jgi:hypothetical protein
VNASAPAGSVMHVPYAFRIKRVFPARSSAVIALAMLKGSCFSPCAAVQRKASNLLAFPKGCSPAIAEASYEMAPEPKKSLLLGLPRIWYPATTVQPYACTVSVELHLSCPPAQTHP